MGMYIEKIRPLPSPVRRGVGAVKVVFATQKPHETITQTDPGQTPLRFALTLSLRHSHILRANRNRENKKRGKKEKQEEKRKKKERKEETYLAIRLTSLLCVSVEALGRAWSPIKKLVEALAAVVKSILCRHLDLVIVVRCSKASHTRRIH